MSRFRVGVAVREITPATGTMQWGFSARKTPAEGTLDPLYAKAIVFDAGGENIAVVSLDLGRVPTDAVMARVRAKAQAWGVANVMFCATHTHHGPVVEDDTAPHVAPIEAAIGDAIEDASSTSEPAHWGIGRATVDIGHNRRKLVDDQCFMVWRNEDKEPTGAVDREATFIRIESDSGRLLATLVHYACHPVVLGPANVLFSADYVGELTRCVSEVTGAPCLFIQGACGDINPYFDKTPVVAHGVETMREVGRSAAEAIIAALAEVSCRPPDQPGVKYSEKPMRVGTRWDFSDDRVKRTFQSFHVGLFDKYVEELDPNLVAPLSVLVLNRELALVGIPGEPPIQYQLDLKASSPVRHGLVCGYTNGYQAYFPSVRDALAGGYGGTVASYVELGAGERMMAEAKVEIARLLGKDHRLCTADDFVVRTLGT